MITTAIRPDVRVSVLLLISILFGGAQLASAQAVATSFDELQGLIKPGDRIDITDTTGHKTKGRLGELSASSLELLVRKTGSDGRETLVPQARLSEKDVQQIRLERRDSLWNGALIGFSPGATIGMIMLFYGAGCDCYTIESRAPFALLTIAFAGGIGAGIGAGVDAALIKRTTVYLRPPAPGRASIRIAPQFTSSGPGIQMAVRF